MTALVYVGLEPYEERYTAQMSSKGGWFDRAFNRMRDEKNRQDIALLKARGKSRRDKVRTGKVLDAHGRCVFAMEQTTDIIQMAEDGLIRDGDVIYFEDMFHPGFESLPYVFHLQGVKPRIFARCHAQSIDVHDFTYPMKDWIRHFERGITAACEKIFMASDCHIDTAVGLGMGPREKFVKVGLPICSEEILEHVPDLEFEKQRIVVFTSRWDDEKQPWFFRQVAERVCSDCGYDWARFVATTSRPENSPSHLRMIEECKGSPVEVMRVDKKGYYRWLDRAKVQFNCALQDYVSNTLIEASIFKCHPVYPKYLSFPDEFVISDWENVFYEPFNIDDAADKVVRALERREDDYCFDYIYEYHDETYNRIFKVMLGDERFDI